MFLLFLGLTLGLGSCLEDELAFDIIESPVLAVFEHQGADDMIKIKATFYELDKSGILDHTIGIDSMPIPNLEIGIFIFEDQLIGNVTTDSKGELVFEAPASSLSEADKLEWVGKYKDTAFRIYEKF